MKISIALCTYNGARFLPEQLASIAAQTRPPDELIVCDDRSQDDTVDIIRRFAKTVGFPVSLHINDENLGSFQNFGKAIGLCEGDLIALCDQDDVWLPEKLTRIASEFENNSKLGLLFTDATVVDAQRKPLGFGIFTFFKFTEAERRAILQGRGFYALLRRNVVTGATAAFRSDWRSLVLPIERNSFLAHDGWIALLISAVAPIAFLDETLIEYRQHDSQIQGIRINERKSEPMSAYETHVQQLTSLRERLQGVASPPEDLPKKIKWVDSQIRHVQARIDMPRNKIRRLPSIIKELLRGRYHRYSNGFYSAARDLLHRQQGPS
jgi:glycosyltransferase involved in cell wall biosynthesis